VSPVIITTGRKIESAAGNRAVRTCVRSLGRPAARSCLCPNVHISLVAGMATTPPTPGFTGDSGQAISAELDSPAGLWVDASHNIYIVDKDNDRIRKVSSSGIITTVGRLSTAEVYAGDGGKATSASLNEPNGIAFDSEGNMYIADTGNSVIRKVNTSASFRRLPGIISSAFNGDGGPAIDANLSEPTSVPSMPPANLYMRRQQQRLHPHRDPGPKHSHLRRATASYLPFFPGDGGPASPGQAEQALLRRGGRLSGDVLLSATPKTGAHTRSDAQLHHQIPLPALGTAGFADGPALQAEFSGPSASLSMPREAFYIADRAKLQDSQAPAQRQRRHHRRQWDPRLLRQQRGRLQR